MKIALAVIIATGLTGLLLWPGAVEAHPATGIVVDRKGQVYFSDLETIWKIDLQGKLSVFRAGVSGRHVHELSIDAQDNIYGADVTYNPATKGFPSDVWKMTLEGKFTYLLEPTEHPPRGMSIWRDRDGNMYLIDQNNHTKSQTLLLRRTPDGGVTTLAGSAYGHKDGRGTQANFSSVGGIAFGPDGSMFLTDGSSVRKVSLDGVVTTIAQNLNFRTADDKPTLFGGAYGTLAGLAVDSYGNVYVADAGNRRLLEIKPDGKVEVVYRADPPFFPNGVVTTPAGLVYVMEFSFTPPSNSGGPRIRRLSDGKNEVIAVVGNEAHSGSQTLPVEEAGTASEIFTTTFSISSSLKPWVKVAIVFFGLGLTVSSLLLWQRRRRERQS